MPQVDLHLVGNDVRQRGLAQSGWAEDQHVIERLGAFPRCLDEDPHLLLDARLTDVLVELLRANRTIERPVVSPGFAARQSLVFDSRHGLLRHLSQSEPNNVFG